MRTRKLIEVAGERYKILRAYEEKGCSYVEYRDPHMEKTLWTRLGVTRRTRLMKNGWIRYNKEVINFWNPLSWPVTLTSLLIAFLLHGMEGLKVSEPFKPIIDQCEWVKKDEVKIINPVQETL